MNLRLVTVAMLFLGLVGCSSIVRKPEITNVKKVAIASFYANEEVHFKHGDAKFNSWQLQTKATVAQKAYAAFNEEFKRLGWQTIPYTTVLSNKVYQEEFGGTETKPDDGFLKKAGAFMTTLHNNTYFTIPKMTPIEWDKKEEHGRKVATISFGNTHDRYSNRPLPERLEALANSLGVDAVVLVHMDYCYGDGASVLGNGTAHILGQGTMFAVDRRGVPVVNIPAMTKKCDDGKYSGKSNRTTAIVARQLVFGDMVQTNNMIGMFYEASKATAHNMVAEIDRAIKEN